MAYLGKGRKEDLAYICRELGEEIPPEARIIDLKRIITGSDTYEEEFVRELLNVAIEEREKEKEREAREHEFRMKKLEMQRDPREDRSESGLAGEEFPVKEPTFMQYSKLMKGIIAEIPERPEEWPFFFRHLEMMFKLYEVPQSYWGKITLLQLKGKVKGLINSLGEEYLEDYEKIKDRVLKEFQINPLQHKKNLEQCRKRYEESYTQYVNRVKTALELYLQSRKVTTFEKLQELLVVDKVKDNLPGNLRGHIYLKETEKWLVGSELAIELDNYVQATPKWEMNRQGNNGVNSKFLSEPRPTFLEQKKGYRTANFRDQHDKMGMSKLVEHTKRSIKCFNCHEEGHMKRMCPKNNSIAREKKNEDYSLEKRGLNKICAQVKHSLDNLRDIPISEKEKDLPRVEILIDNVKVSGVVDSGAEITVLRKSVVPKKFLEEGGIIVLQPAIGPQVEAQLVSIPLSLGTGEDEVRAFVRVTVAVVDGLNETALITPQVYRSLKAQREMYLGVEPGEVICEFPEEKHTISSMAEVKELRADPTDSGNNGDGEVKTVLVEEVTVHEESKENNPPISQVQKFRKEQSECQSLQEAFAKAERKERGYWIQGGLLYHTGDMCGQKYQQLVIPMSRRKEIIRLAHETYTGGHLGAKKTRDRIVMSFWWEGVMKDVKQWCGACRECQLRGRTKVNDRAPIQAVGRPELPFQVVNADVLGPIEPVSARGHKYILCVMDQHSRWPEAVPLRAITAKTTCEAFMEIFMRTGVPQMIAMDNATNFTSKLTKEFLARLGVAPKFSTPGYPQSNGLVERFIGTMKSMLHHAIRVQGKSWDKQLPYLLWAYREVPNATTGVPPFMLVYGRLPTGPLAILKSSWEDETVIPQGVGESVSDYLKGLRDKLKLAEDFASRQAEEQQRKYVHHHNLRSSEKEFGVGDEVVVLIPDSTNKLCARWTGPGEIVGIRSPHSYLVKLPDGSTRHLHQNKLKKYVQPINAMGVIFESDGEFGEVLHVPVEERERWEEWLEEIEKSGSWVHLEKGQRQQLAKVIQEYHTVFDGEIKRAKVGSHVIQLKPGVERKQPHIYRIPEAIRPQVEEQMKELLDRGLIEPSTAEIVYPIVCVAKKDGTIRLCCDYRKLNSESKITPFPMQNSEELRLKAGAAKYLSTIDILKGYWEIPLDKNSRELTSFVSPKGQYQWKVMPFGLSGAAATFQRTMNTILRSHSGYAESFIDDIIVYSATFEKHLQHLRKVFETLRNLQFSANLRKCQFVQDKVKYLGHIIGSGKHGPDPDKVEVIKKLQEPKTKKALRSVLGLINYYREYVPRYAEIARPLTELTKKSIPNEIPWPEQAQKAFRALKEALCNVISMYTPDLTKPFEVHTDASSTGIGACLLQRDEEGRARPIIFASQKLTDAQVKWSTIEREAYAVIWALKKFETWTYGQQIVLYSDHNPLKYLTEGIPKNARLQRWALALPRYNVSVAYKPGNKNADADALSRIE